MIRGGMADGDLCPLPPSHLGIQFKFVWCVIIALETVYILKGILANLYNFLSRIYILHHFYCDIHPSIHPANGCINFIPPFFLSSSHPITLTPTRT